MKSNSTTTNIAVGAGPWGVSLDGTYCWVVNNGSNNVTRITKSTGTVDIPAIAVGTTPFSLGDMTGYAYDNYSRVP